MKTTLILYFKIFILSFVAFLAPLETSFHLVSMLVIADTITGIMKAGRKDIKNVWSRKIFGFVPKIIFYFVLVICAHGVAQIEPKIPFVKLSLLGVAFIEIKSIDENFRSLFGFSFIDKVLTIARDLKNVNRKQS